MQFLIATLDFKEGLSDSKWFNFTLEGSLAFNILNHDYTMNSLLLEIYQQNQNKARMQYLNINF